MKAQHEVGREMTDGKEQPDEQMVGQLEQVSATLTALTQEVERLQKWQPLVGNLRRRLWQSFALGIASGLGRTLGATIVLALLVWLIGKLKLVPGLGRWVAQLIEAIQAVQQGF